MEGAATGIGGIVRDVYCMGAEVIGCLDPLRFGDPDGANGRRVRDIVRGVVETTCKTFVTQRVMRSGMRWSQEERQAILLLRSLIQSQRSERG